MVRINKTSFGSITVNGKKFNTDISIDADGIIEEKEKSHKITKEDLENLLLKEPEIVIVGNGQKGLAKITDEGRNFIEKEKTSLIELKTLEAIEYFNKIKKRKAGIFHVTC